MQKVLKFNVLFIILLSCSDDRASFTVKKQNIVESVYSSVTIEPDNVQKVASSVSGYLDQVYVKTGDTLSIGDTLFVIRDVQSFSTTANALLNLELAQKNYRSETSLLEESRLELSNLKLKLKNDSVTYTRNLELYKNGLLTKVEFEQSELNYEASKNTVENAKNKLKRMERDLKYSIEQAQNTYKSSLARSGDAFIRSSIDGLVYDITKEPGEFVAMQEPIAVVGSESNFVISMLIDEVDIIRVKKGQEIVVSLEAFPDQVFTAKVTRISPKMDERTQTFEVEGQFTDTKEPMFMGLTGEANIIVDHKKGVMVIPGEYLLEGNYVETDEGRVKVQTGIRSLSHVEIISGLKVGSVIFKPE